MKVNYQLHMVAGNLTADVKSTDKYASFTVALDVGFGDKKTSHFMNMTAFPSSFSEKMWGLVTSLKKGSTVMVEYQESDGSYDKDGVKVYAVKRIVSKLSPVFGDKPATEQGETASTTKARVPSKAKAVDVDDEEGQDLPF